MSILSWMALEAPEMSALLFLVSKFWFVVDGLCAVAELRGCRPAKRFGFFCGFAF